jgi:hypothetical protein
MKKRLVRLSAEKNAWFVAVVLGIGSSLVVIPIVVIVLLLRPAAFASSPQFAVMLLAPPIYFVMGYIGTLVVCLI